MFYFCNTAAISTRSWGIKTLPINIFSCILLVIYCVELPCHHLLRWPFQTLDGRELSSCFTYGTLMWCLLGQYGVKTLTCWHLQCYSYSHLVNLLHWITVNLPVICGISQFELVLEGRQVAQERSGHNALMFYQLFRLCKQVFLMSYISMLFFFFFLN